MSDERKRCPKCGEDFDHMVCDGEVLQFKCGTLQGRTRTERVIESEDCLRRQLARAQEQLRAALDREERLRRVEWWARRICQAHQDVEQIGYAQLRRAINRLSEAINDVDNTLALLDDEKGGDGE